MSLEATIRIADNSHAKLVAKRAAQEIKEYVEHNHVEFPPGLFAIGDNWFYAARLDCSKGIRRVSFEEVGHYIFRSNLDDTSLSELIQAYLQEIGGNAAVMNFAGGRYPDINRIVTAVQDEGKLISVYFRQGRRHVEEKYAVQ